MLKLGVVIQGPMISWGFDCTEYVQKLVKAFAAHSMVTHVVLSTWESESLVGISKESKFTIIKTRCVVGKDQSNRYKQTLSSFEGVKFIKNNTDATHIIKIRTDQLIDISIIDFIVDFYDSYLSSSAKTSFSHLLSAPIIFSYINRTYPFHIGDFYFAAQIDDASLFLESVLSFNRQWFQQAVEQDIVIKFLISEDKNFPLPWWVYLKHMCIARKYNRDHLVWRYWLSVYKEYFAPFPREILLSMKWRGKPFIDELNQKVLHGRAQNVVESYFDFNKEWTMLNNNIEKYILLPIDTHQYRNRVIYDEVKMISKAFVLFSRLFFFRYLRLQTNIVFIARQRFIQLRNRFTDK
jgi:hypothetical protein